MTFLLSRRWILFLLAVVLLALLAYRLGEWQFDRLEDREQRNEITERNLALDPVPVAEVMSTDDAVDPQDEWRRVEMVGTYDDAGTVVVRYQTREGASGIDVVTPLVTDDGTAVLVNRGWVRTQNAGDFTDAVPPPPAGEVTVVGWLRADTSGDATAVDDGSTRAISAQSIGAGLDYPVYDGFVEAESESPAPDQALAPVELPDLSEGPHFFYGLQWWFFAALAVFGFGYLAYDERRGGPRRKRRGGSTDEDDEDGDAAAQPQQAGSPGAG